MKKIKLFVLVVVAGMLSACSGSLHLENQENLNEIIQKTADIFGEENVISVTVNSKDHLDDTFGDVDILYKKDDKYYVITYYNGSLTDPRDVTKTTRDHLKNVPSKKVSDFTMDNIVELFHQGADLLQKDQDNTLEYFYLRSVEKEVRKDGSFGVSFTIECTKKGEGSQTQRRGRRVEVTTNYYSVDVEVKRDGSLELKY